MASLSILTLHGFLLFVGAELIFSLTPVLADTIFGKATRRYLERAT